MAVDPNLTGLLLAGGRSSRMGTDKARLVVGDSPPLARKLSAMLARICGSVLIASGDGRRLGWLGLWQIPDPEPDSGPLAGLLAGLEAAKTGLVAVVAVDMPDASEAVLDLLADRAASTGCDAAVPRTERGLEPLHAVYAKTAAPLLRAAFDAGERSVTRALGALDLAIVEPDEWAFADPSGRFARNLNRPEDLSG